MTYFTYSSNELLCSLILMSVFSMISSIALANWLQSASSVKMPFWLFIISIIPPEHFAPITGVLNNSASNMVDALQGQPAIPAARAEFPVRGGPGRVERAAQHREGGQSGGTYRA